MSIVPFGRKKVMIKQAQMKNDNFGIGPISRPKDVSPETLKSALLRSDNDDKDKMVENSKKDALSIREFVREKYVSWGVPERRIDAIDFSKVFKFEYDPERNKISGHVLVPIYTPSTNITSTEITQFCQELKKNFEVNCTITVEGQYYKVAFSSIEKSSKEEGPFSEFIKNKKEASTIGEMIALRKEELYNKLRK